MNDEDLYLLGSRAMENVTLVESLSYSSGCEEDTVSSRRPSSFMPLNAVLLLLVTSIGSFPLTFNPRPSELSACGVLPIPVDLSVEAGIAYLIFKELGYDVVQPLPLLRPIRLFKGLGVRLIRDCEFKVRHLIENDLRYWFFFHRHPRILFLIKAPADINPGLGFGIEG